jgi:hypothetical protein|tara:strand:+ start:310 stop:522 length:213 start_codon:yes stop_codon:yes gene_type:complete
MTKQEQQQLIEKLKDDVFELRQELKLKQNRIEELKQLNEKVFEQKLKLKLNVLNSVNKFKEQLKKDFKKW